MAVERKKKISNNPAERNTIMKTLCAATNELMRRKMRDGNTFFISIDNLVANG